MTDHGYHAVAGLLGTMMAGIAATHRNAGADAPDVSASAITQDGDRAVVCKLHLPSGDTYLVRVEWLKDESP